MFLRKVILFVALFLNTFAWAAPLSEAEKLSDFRVIIQRIKSGYGPKEYKKLKNIDLDEVAQRYEQLVSQTKNNGQYYYLLGKMIAEFQDGHFGLLVPTTHKAVLGFYTDFVAGKVLISGVDRNVLSTAVFPFERGDEIVMFNGMPVEAEIESVAQYIGTGYRETLKRRATMMLTQRMGMRVPVPAGSAKVTVFSRSTQKTKTVALNWIESGIRLDEGIDRAVTLAKNNVTDVSPRKPFMLSMEEDIRETLFDKKSAEFDFMCNPGTRIALPEGAQMIGDLPFTAYTYPTEKGVVGYLRIPHYYPRNEKGEPLYMEWLGHYQYAIDQLERNTVGLIIDQDHNCGGSVDYLETMVSFFADKPFSGVQFEFLASKEEYLKFSGWLAEFLPGSLPHHYFKEVVDLVENTWREGKSFLTTKASFSGGTKLNTIYPQGIRYTKPIIMTIDEMSGSGGDAFPAMMQGIGRAKLLGTRTSGLGGHVEVTTPMFYSAVSMRMTKSLFFHPNGTAIENNGATPDIPYLPTENDFVSGYKDYQKFYTQELLKLL